jgi:hypothetical protein
MGKRVGLPKSVKIGGMVYKVQYSPELNDVALCGRIQLLHSVIELRPNMSPDIELLTLVHESAHGYLFQAGVKEHDEQHIDVLSNGMVQFVRDNPGLLK